MHASWPLSNCWSRVSFPVSTSSIISFSLILGESQRICRKCNKFLPLSELCKHIGSCKGKSHRKRDHQDHPVTRRNLEDWSMDDDVQMLVNTCNTALLQLFSLKHIASVPLKLWWSCVLTCSLPEKNHEKPKVAHWWVLFGYKILQSRIASVHFTFHSLWQL